MAELRSYPSGALIPRPPLPQVSARVDRGAVLAQPLLLAIVSSAVDFDGHLEKVAALAQAQGARLRLAYASDRDPGPGMPRPLARLRQRARYLGRLLDRPVETLDVEIRSPQALRQAVEDCSLVCVAKPAPNAKAGKQQLLRALIELRLRPLLLMARREAPPYRRVLVPMSLGPGSRQLLRWADRLAPAATLELLHVTELPEPRGARMSAPPPSVLDEVLQQAWASLHRRLHTVSEGLDGDDWESLRGLSYRLATGDVGEAILHCQRSGGHDLVVIGQRAPRPWPSCLSWLRRELAPRLLADLGCDLLLLPQPGPRVAPMSWLEGRDA